MKVPARSMPPPMPTNGKRILDDFEHPSDRIYWVRPKWAYEDNMPEMHSAVVNLLLRYLEARAVDPTITKRRDKWMGVYQGYEIDNTYGSLNHIHEAIPHHPIARKAWLQYLLVLIDELRNDFNRVLPRDDLNDLDFDFDTPMPDPIAHTIRSEFDYTIDRLNDLLATLTHIGDGIVIENRSPISELPEEKVEAENHSPNTESIDEKIELPSAWENLEWPQIESREAMRRIWKRSEEIELLDGKGHFRERNQYRANSIAMLRAVLEVMSEENGIERWRTDEDGARLIVQLFGVNYSRRNFSEAKKRKCFQPVYDSLIRD